MVPARSTYAVLLHGSRVGTLRQRGDHTQFSFVQEYLETPNRPVLGLRFEENLGAPYSAALRLPRWFSNLLPEGPLRAWIAADRGVSPDREMELLAQVGHDLPGAVQVVQVESDDETWEPTGRKREQPTPARSAPESPWRFSLAGVALKFSMLERGNRLTVPARGENGDWLVKFPDYRFPDVPRNEYAMMSIARDAGLDVPDVRLVHRDDLEGLPARMWPNDEQWAYAIRRFDRHQDADRTPVHIEDLAQVRDKYPDAKYEGDFETIAALVYRGRDVRALREMVRRLAFSILVGNGDAHLKNWSLIYPDQRIPTLAPVYDIVSTVAYRSHGGHVEDLGLRFDGSKRFEAVRLSSFGRLGDRLATRFGAIDADLVETAVTVCDDVMRHWAAHREILAGNTRLAAEIDGWIRAAQARIRPSR